MYAKCLFLCLSKKNAWTSKFDLFYGLFHPVHGIGMWECIGFYSISKHDENGGLKTPVSQTR
jgi:hypothetical protein